MAEPQNLDREEMARKDHETKLALRKKEVEYYAEKLAGLGLKATERFARFCPDPSKFVRLGITYAHQGLEGVAEAMADKKPWAVVSGLNPSGPLHLGHKAIFDELLWMQQQGADVFIPITNDESYVVGKSPSLGAARRIAYEQVIPSIVAMGFDPRKTKIFVDSDYPDIYNAAMYVSTGLTLNKAFGVFGFNQKEEGENPGTMFYRAAVQVAQILLPQFEEFGGPRPTVIPVGIDQHPYLLLARDVAEKKKFIPPAELVTKFLWGLDGKGKMSASRPASAIFLTDDPAVAEKKLRSAYTGGSPIASFQRIHGGVPEICPIWSVRTYHFERDNHVAVDCLTAKVLCGECKRAAVASVVDYLREHQAKLPVARERMDEFILKTPLRSILRYS